MKKVVPYLFLVTLFLFSCKKEHSKSKPTPDKKLYPVTVNVSGFTQTITNAANGKLQVNGIKTNAITDYLKVFYYIVFDKDENLVHIITQDSTSTNFGNISDNLPSGTYTVIISAGQAGLTLFPSSAIVGSARPGDFSIFYGDGSGTSVFKDTFYDKFQLVVSGAPVVQNVTASRVVGQLEIDINDAIPAQAQKMEVTISNESFRFILASGLPSTSIPVKLTTIIPASAKGTTNYKLLNRVFLNTVSPFTVKIVCYDSSSAVLGTANITNVTCEKNRRTILSGELFSALNGSNNGFNITLSNWDPSVITFPFTVIFDPNK